ncbi:hypothetical protein ACJBF7_24340, partial [Enterobacter sp. 04-C-01-SI_S15]
SSLRPLMAGSSPSLPDGSNPSAAIVQSASDVQCSRLLKTTDTTAKCGFALSQKVDLLFWDSYYFDTIF